MNRDTCDVIYHSPEWERLVEHGWITHDVGEPREHGARIARMVLPLVAAVELPR